LKKRAMIHPYMGNMVEVLLRWPCGSWKRKWRKVFSTQKAARRFNMLV
jgi:hypothetical protein